MVRQQVFPSERVAAWLCISVGAAAVLVGALTSIYGRWSEAWPSWLGAALLFVAAGAERARWRGTRATIALVLALMVGVLTPEPFVTQQFSVGVLIVSVLTALLLGPGWVVGASVITYGLLLARSGTLGPYDDSVTLVLVGLVVGGMTLSRHLADQARRESIATAAARAHDAARLRASEERYRLIAEHSYDLIALLDARSHFVYASPAFGRLGYDPVALCGQPAFAAIHPDDLAAVQAAWQQVQNGARALTTFRYPDSTGMWHWFDASGTPFQWQNQPVALVTAHDVTARVVAEQEHRRVQAQLLHVQKLEGIGRLAGGMAHDINNLLTVIIGHAELGLQTTEGPSRDDFTSILETGERAAQLTRRVLAFARRQVLAPHPLRLNSLIYDLDRLLRRLLSEQIELVTLFDEQLGLVNADASQLEQVLVNLVVNARDAMPNGGTITLQTRAVVLGAPPPDCKTPLPPGNYALLTVRDTGFGMTPEVLAHLFEPFFTTKPPGQGTGLGLATVYGIVRQHGGDIWAESVVGQGTAMHLYLPCVSQQPHLPSPVPVPVRPTPLARRATVLVVEDEPQVRLLAVRVLRRAGYLVLEAANGDEALQLLRDDAVRERVDLLLSDLVMPLMGGRELAALVRRARPTLPVLFMSGYSDAEQLPAGTETLQKPFTPSLLAAKVRNALHHNDSSRQGGPELCYTSDAPAT